MSRPRPGATVVVALAAAIMVGRMGWAGLGAWARSKPAPAVRTIAVAIHYSHFSPALVSIPAGTTVRFVIRNTDPIDHEFIVGDPALQHQEEVGTDTVHDGDVPGRVSVPAGTTRSTTVVIPRAGPLLFACHLPGHYAYGMYGTIRITAAT